MVSHLPALYRLGKFVTVAHLGPFMLYKALSALQTAFYNLRPSEISFKDSGLKVAVTPLFGLKLDHVWIL